MRRLFSLVMACALVVQTTGCFHYAVVEEVPARGTAIRADFTRPVPVSLQAMTVNNVVGVRGEIVTVEPEQLLLSAFALQSATEYEHFVNGETVAIPRDALGRIEEKRLSVGRTLLAGAAILGAGILIQLGLSGALGGGEEGGGGGPID